MASSPNWPPELAERFGPLRIETALGSRVRRARAGDTDVVVKSGPAVRDEAEGLRRLREAPGAPRVPQVLHSEDGLLVLEWIPPGSRRAEGDEMLGRGLAHLHAVADRMWGGGSAWIGECPVDPAPSPSAAGFYGRRLGELAARCGLTAEVAPVVERLPSLVPPGGPAVLHGDLWWGNVLWDRHGRPVLIDPSVHGGHPEEDLAMLALFGDLPRRLVDAYVEVQPLDAGWQDRVALWQLYPLLVHTVLFGGSYRSSALAAARCYR